MRKLGLMIISVLLMLSFIGCDTEKGTKTPDWGIELSTTNITPTGLTLVCNQSGGNQKGDLQTSDFYTLEVQRDNQWAPVENLSPEASNTFFEDKEYILPLNDKIEWNLNWEQLYGELPAGSYRLIKRIAGHTGTGLKISETSYETDFHVLTYYAYFEIEK